MEIHRRAEVPGCHNVRVFGSVATGEANAASDVDFLVDLEQGRGLLDLGAMVTDLNDLLGVSTDLVESSCIHPYVRERVLAEAVDP